MVATTEDHSNPLDTGNDIKVARRGIRWTGRPEDLARCQLMSCFGGVILNSLLVATKR